MLVPDLRPQLTSALHSGEWFAARLCRAVSWGCCEIAEHPVPYSADPQLSPAAPLLSLQPASGETWTSRKFFARGAFRCRFGLGSSKEGPGRHRGLLLTSASQLTRLAPWLLDSWLHVLKGKAGWKWLKIAQCICNWICPRLLWCQCQTTVLLLHAPDLLNLKLYVI